MPDNLKSGITSPCRYEPDVNPTYQELADHYDTAVIPARVRKPKDKAKVEAGVKFAETWILAALRNHTFFSLGELNQAIAEKLTELNNKKFKKLPTTRRQQFEKLDKPALKPLPERRYEYALWKKARVNIDYHIEIERHYYSVPYQLVRKRLDVRLSGRTKTGVSPVTPGATAKVDSQRFLSICLKSTRNILSGPRRGSSSGPVRQAHAQKNSL